VRAAWASTSPPPTSSFSTTVTGTLPRCAHDSRFTLSCRNPHADAQAMDRAHRIGQRRPVRVYRFITDVRLNSNKHNSA
jgi:hypothetical protein